MESSSSTCMKLFGSIISILSRLFPDPKIHRHLCCVRDYLVQCAGLSLPAGSEHHINVFSVALPSHSNSFSYWPLDIKKTPQIDQASGSSSRSAASLAARLAKSLKPGTSYLSASRNTSVWYLMSKRRNSSACLNAVVVFHRRTL